MRASDQILDYLDGPKPAANQNRYGIIDALGDMRGADMSIDQLQHYLVNRRTREQFKGEESVFDELVRLAAQADEETADVFGRIANEEADDRRARKLATDVVGSGVDERVLVKIAYGMLRDGWAESQVAFGLTTLGAQVGSTDLPTDLDAWTDAQGQAA
jgi:hypothetical protein